MITKDFVQLAMPALPRARPTACVIRGHCRTLIFEFPGAELKSKVPLKPAVIVQRAGAKATLVSDLRSYFRDCTGFRHYAICCSLRSKIKEVISKRGNGVANWHPLFVVLEQESPCETRMDEGTCFEVDQKAIAGGLEGEYAIVAWQVGGAPWPNVDVNDTDFVNVVLGAVKIVQDEVAVIRELVESACFYDESGRAVYPQTAQLSAAGQAIAPLSQNEADVTIDRLRKLTNVLAKERAVDKERVDNLVDSLRLEKIDTDSYRRAWYLSLFESVKAVLSGHDKQQFNQRHRAYRKQIGHPTARTRMDSEEFLRLQRDSLAELRRIFL